MVVIGVLSGKGGVGKTTVVANLGAVLSYEFEKKVVILDSCITTSHLGLHFGLYDEPPFTLIDVLERKVSITQAVYIHSLTSLRIIPASLTLEEKIKLKNLNKFINQLDTVYEIIIIDCPPTLGKNVINIINAIEDGLIVTTPQIPDVVDALKTINLLQKMKKRIRGLVVNRVKGEKYELKIPEIKSMCDQPIISIIPEDSKISESIRKGIPICLYDRNSKAAIQLRKLAAYLIGEGYPTPSLISRIKNFFTFKRMKIDSGLFYPEKTRSKKVKEVNLDKLKSKLKREIKKELKKEIAKLRRKLKS